MATVPEGVFQYEVESVEDAAAGPITTIVCHGRVTSETSGQLKEVVKPLIPKGGRIVLDLTDVSYVDSSGLGTLVGLKVSALKEGYCRLELVNLSARVKELLRLSNLTSFSLPKPVPQGELLASGAADTRWAWTMKRRGAAPM